MTFYTVQCTVSASGNHQAKHSNSTDSTSADVVLGFNSTTVKTKSVLRAAVMSLLTQVDGSKDLTD